MNALSIGTLIKGGEEPQRAIRELAPLGFEGFSLMYWGRVPADLRREAEEIRKAGSETGKALSSLALYGNPLGDDEKAKAALAGIDELIERAADFGCSLVGCFAGRLPGASVPDSLEAWKAAFGPLADKAEAKGVRIAFENCRMGDSWKSGKWNIAINPDAWELMFDALPSAALGLEWEPCHQVEALADPAAQLKAWLPRILHIHGKDARIDRALLAAKGLYGKERWHRSCLPGNGDSDWPLLYRLLLQSGYRGSVDIEGWNDEEWSGDREIAGQRKALAYLSECRAKAMAELDRARV